jgi:hypothetical protein
MPFKLHCYTIANNSVSRLYHIKYQVIGDSNLSSVIARLMPSEASSLCAEHLYQDPVTASKHYQESYRCNSLCVIIAKLGRTASA